MLNFIDWSDIDTKNRIKGTLKTTCPNCSHERKNKKDPCLYVNLNDGVAKCFNCDSLSFREQETNYAEKQYTKFDESWKNYTKLSDKLIKWVENERKIKQFALIDLGVTEEKAYQPKHGKEVNNIVFNYFEGETLVNKKYRSGDKSFTQSTGGKPIFYNINSVIGEKECYIVEGEFDVLALYSFGVKNVISVPNGANDNDEYWKNSEKYLKDIEKFVIAVDNDEKGNDLKEKIAQRLGRWRCEFIEWSHKDANGSLINNELESDLHKRKKFPVSGTWRIEDLKDGIYNLYNNGLPETIAPKSSCFGNLKNIFSIMPGQLTVVTGIPSHGKSNFSEWWGLNIIKDYDLKLSLFSPEHTPMELHQTVLMQKAIGRNFWKSIDGRPRITPVDIERYINWANEKIYITLPEKGESPNWDWIFDKFKEQMYAFGVNVFLIDAFNKVLGVRSKEDIDNVLTRLTSFAQINNVSVVLIAHPTKMKKIEDGTYDVPTLYDVSGSADFRNQTHNGFAVHRYFETPEQKGYTKFVNLKTKFSFQGDIGADMDFYYDEVSGRYYARNEPIPMFDLTLTEEKKIQPNMDFDVDFDNPIPLDQVPF